LGSVLLLLRKLSLILLGLAVGKWITGGHINLPDCLYPRTATMLFPGSGLIVLAGYGRKKFFKK